MVQPNSHRSFGGGRIVYDGVHMGRRLGSSIALVSWKIVRATGTVFVLTSPRLRNRNVCLVVIQTWLVGMVYYGGSKFSHPRHRLSSLLYPALPTKRSRLRDHRVRGIITPPGPLASSHHRHLRLCHQMDGACTYFVLDWILCMAGRTRGPDYIRPEYV
jgi:hypothetical protein